MKYHSRLPSKFVDCTGFRFGLPPPPVLFRSEPQLEAPNVEKSGMVMVCEAAKRNITSSVMWNFRFALGSTLLCSLLVSW